MAAFTSSDFLEQVKLVGSIPEGRYTDPEILSLAYNLLISNIVPMILAQKEEYYVRSEGQSVVTGQASYPIPYRAFGLSLREVKIVRNGTIVDLPRIDLTAVTSTSAGSPSSFYLEAQDVVLYPTPQSSEGTIRLSYFLTPSRLVEITEVGLITSIDRNTGIITAAVPSSWTTGNSFDLVSSKNGHQTKAFDLTATNVSAQSSITFSSSDIPSSIVVGDYVCLAGESPFLQMPDACYQYAIQLTVNQLYSSMGAQAENQAGEGKAQQFQAMIVTVLQNRVQGAPKKLRIPL